MAWYDFRAAFGSRPSESIKRVGCQSRPGGHPLRFVQKHRPGRLLPDALIGAIERNYIDTWTNLGRADGERYQDDEVVRVASAIPYIPCNGAFHSRWQDKDVDAEIEAHVVHFRARNAQVLWAVNPSARPRDLAEHLQALGFTLVQQLVGMAMDLNELPDRVEMPADTKIGAVRDAHSLRQFVDLVARKWHLPPDANDFLYAINLRLGLSMDWPGRVVGRGNRPRAPTALPDPGRAPGR